MMISPESYIKEFEDAGYRRLIQERNHLVNFIKKFEKDEMAGDRSGFDWRISPSPEVRYQLYLEYLSKLCLLMRDKYNQDYVNGCRSLQDDVRRGKSE